MWYRNLSDDIVKKDDIICHPLSWIPTPKVPQLVKFLTRWNMHSPDGIKTAFDHWFNPIGTKFYDNPKIESFDELVRFKASQLKAGMFQGCKKLKYISVPPIPFGIFNDNVISYERVRLCGEWKRIPDYFFWGWEKRNLKAIIIENCIPPKITNISGFFYGNHTTNFAKIYVPNDSVEKYREAAVWKDYKEFIYPLSEYQP